MLYQTGIKKNKKVAYPCLTWKTTFLRKKSIKKNVYNLIIISRLLIYLLAVKGEYASLKAEIICELTCSPTPKSRSCLPPLPIINILIQGGNYMVKIFRKKGRIS